MLYILHKTNTTKTNTNACKLLIQKNFFFLQKRWRSVQDAFPQSKYFKVNIRKFKLKSIYFKPFVTVSFLLEFSKRLH